MYGHTFWFPVLSIWLWQLIKTIWWSDMRLHTEPSCPSGAMYCVFVAFSLGPAVKAWDSTSWFVPVLSAWNWETHGAHGRLGHSSTSMWRKSHGSCLLISSAKEMNPALTLIAETALYSSVLSNKCVHRSVAYTHANTWQRWGPLTPCTGFIQGHRLRNVAGRWLADSWWSKVSFVSGPSFGWLFFSQASSATTLYLFLFVCCLFLLPFFSFYQLTE